MVAKGLKGSAEKKKQRALVADYRIEHVPINFSHKVFFESRLDLECLIIKI